MNKELFERELPSTQEITGLMQNTTTDIFFEMSSVMRQTDSWNGSLASGFPPGYSDRNFALGLCGVLINVITLPLVAKSHNINNGIKALILNMILNDIIFMVSLITYGSKKSSHRSDGEGCWAVVYCLLSSLVMSYLLIFQAALVNFLAIYKPFMFRAASKTKTIIMCIVAAWVYNACLTVFCVGLEFPKKRLCMPLATISRSAVSGLAITTVLCFGGVLFLNTCSIILTRRQVKRSERIGAVPHQPIPNRPRVSLVLVDVKSSSNTDVIFNASCSNESSMNKSVSLPTSSRVTSEANSSIDNLNLVQSSTLEKGKPCVGQHGQTLITASDPRKNKIRSKRRVKVHPFNLESQEAGGASSQTTDGDSSKYLCSSEKRKSIFFKVEVTLIILTTWSCLLSLPFIIYMVWLAAFIEDREKFASGSIGIMCSSLILINSLTNPFFYAWRFIDWRLIYMKIRGFVFTINTGRS